MNLFFAFFSSVYLKMVLKKSSYLKEKNSTTTTPTTPKR